MTYKKYIKKNGKIYGPYIYHSKRVDGKVISEYYGIKEEEIKDNLSKWEKYIFWYSVIVSLGLLFAVAWIWDGIVPRELIKYINRGKKKNGKTRIN